MRQQAVQSGQQEAREHHCSARAKRPELGHTRVVTPRLNPRRPRLGNKAVRIHIASLAQAEVLAWFLVRQLLLHRPSKIHTNRRRDFLKVAIFPTLVEQLV